MAQWQELRSRISALLQREDDPATVLMEVQQSLSWLAREGNFSEVVLIPAIQSQALYALPPTTLRITDVFYNDTVLKFATEPALDAMGLTRSWESLGGEPRFWTTDNQGPNMVRIIPAPLRSGSTTTPLDFLALPMPTKDNIVVFFLNDPALRVTHDQSAMPTTLDMDDLLVYRTAGALAMRETVHMNQPVAEACQALTALWLQALLRSGGA